MKPSSPHPSRPHPRLFPSLLLTFALALILSSCASATRFDGGCSVGAEELASISRALFSSDSQPVEGEESTQGEEHEETEAVTLHLNSKVYHLKNSPVYHADPACPHLSGKRGLLDITLRAAQTIGLSPCRTCTAAHEPASEETTSRP